MVLLRSAARLPSVVESIWLIGAAIGLLLVPVVWGERTGRPKIAAAAKGLASTLFLTAAAFRFEPGDAYDVAVMVGVALCWAGDILLAIPRQRAFLAGLATFLVAHVAFAVAFAFAGLAFDFMVGAALFVVAAAAVNLERHLWPHVPQGMRAPVVAYVLVISAMVVTAVAVDHEVRWWLALAAALFYLSDLAVARQRFVTRHWANRAVGLPLYYGAILLFVATLTMV